MITRNLGSGEAIPERVSVAGSRADEVRMLMKNDDPLVVDPAPAHEVPAEAKPASTGLPMRKTYELWRDRLDRLLGIPLSRIVRVLVSVSAVACTLVVVEKMLGRRHRQSYLIFNLFLAWIPLGFSWLCARMEREGRDRTFVFWGCAMGWLLFLPNAPYLFTDLVHLIGRSLPSYWPDMMKILLFALTGFTAGMLSLEMMHDMVKRKAGWAAGWAFVAVVSALCSIGVSLGRFHRWNSWDALNDPTAIVRDAVSITTSPWISSTTGQFVVTLAILIFCGYTIIHALRGDEGVSKEIPRLSD